MDSAGTFQIVLHFLPANYYFDTNARVARTDLVIQLSLVVFNISNNVVSCKLPGPVDRIWVTTWLQCGTCLNAPFFSNIFLCKDEIISLCIFTFKL